MEESTSVREFMDTRYRDYALYVLYSRAIPSCVDGLKPSQRKVIWTAEKVARVSKIKTAALSGAVTEKANYHHGGTDGVASLMAASWSNNLPLLHGEGNFGSRLVPEHGAPRYTFVKLSKSFDKYFTDSEILPSSVDPEDPEPRYYLPLIPWVLVNGVEGIAIGFATEIQPRDPRILAKICSDYVSGKITREQLVSTEIPPCYPNFDGKILKREDGNWVCRGEIGRKSRTQVEITELPIGIDREKYVSRLDKMEEQGKIVSYEDRCTNGKFRFVIRFPNSVDVDSIDLIKTFGLERVLSENITTIDENGKLKIFGSAGELIAHFCDFRLKKYVERFSAWISRDSARLRMVGLKLSFIEAVVSGEISIGRKTKETLKTEITRWFRSVKDTDLTGQELSSLLEVRTYEFCEEEIQEIKDRVDALTRDISRWREASPQEWYSSELHDLA